MEHKDSKIANTTPGTTQDAVTTKRKCLLGLDKTIAR